MVQERRSHVAEEGRVTGRLLVFSLSRKNKNAQGLICATLAVLTESADMVQTGERYKNINTLLSLYFINKS